MLLFTRLIDVPPAEPQRLLRLSFDERSKSRLALLDDDGVGIAISLPRGTVLRDGDVLATDSGELVRVIAAPQALARISASSPLALMRAVYHLANRHVPAQLALDAVLIERDAVLEHMLEHLGATVDHVDAPFAPEPGAYEGHGHAHGSHGHHHHDEPDAVSATMGEQLSIEAHQRRQAAG